ncbi:MAG TPA: pseudouridine synthase [Vicinamibacterales bacterium]|nr:pseudouridine synthase [Vicinamibacterales bacterium]
MTKRGAARGGGRGPAGVPLDRALSKIGAASRSTARGLIAAGRVSVNGRVVTNPAVRVAPESAQIAIDGVTVRRSPRRLIAFHKPRGTITTRRDPEGRPTVFDLLGDAGEGLVAIGRLDRASTGLLLLTNDTQLAHRLTDPENKVTRRYLVTVRGRVSPDEARRLERGLDAPTAGGGSERLAASRVAIRKASGRETHLTVELTEGKNREVRRLFDAVGHEVTRLHRVSFGSIELGDLEPGAWRDLGRNAIDHR